MPKKKNEKEQGPEKEQARLPGTIAPPAAAKRAFARAQKALSRATRELERDAEVAKAAKKKAGAAEAEEAAAAAVHVEQDTPETERAYWAAVDASWRAQHELRAATEAASRSRKEVAESTRNYLSARDELREAGGVKIPDPETEAMARAVRSEREAESDTEGLVKQLRELENREPIVKVEVEGEDGGGE